MAKSYLLINQNKIHFIVVVIFKVISTITMLYFSCIRSDVYPYNDMFSIIFLIFNFWSVNMY